MKRFIVVLFILLVSVAQADGITVEPFAGGIKYSFQTDEEYVILECKTNAETIKQTVYSENGMFAGESCTCKHLWFLILQGFLLKPLKGYDLLSQPFGYRAL